MNFHQVTIDGKVYQIKIVNGRVGFRVMQALNKIVLPLLGESQDANRHDDVFHGAPKTFKDMAETLIKQLDNIELERIVFDDLLGELSCDGFQVKLENVIMGKYSLLFALVTESLKVNFGELFEGKHSPFNFLSQLVNSVGQTSAE